MKKPKFEEVKDEFDDADLIKFASYFTDFADHNGWQIKVYGGLIKTDSGKSLWKTKGHAKAALKQHLHWSQRDSFLTFLACKYFKDAYARESDKKYDNFIDFAEQKGILEFIELK
jgi:hypothetical protein